MAVGLVLLGVAWLLGGRGLQDIASDDGRGPGLPLAFGALSLALGALLCVAAWRQRAGVPLISRRVGGQHPPDGTEFAVVRSRAVPTGALVALSATVAGLLASVIWGMDWGQYAVPSLGWVFAVAVLAVGLAGAFAQCLRARREPPRLWLTADALVFRDPTLIADDLRIAREDVARISTAPVDSEREPEHTAVLSPFLEKSDGLLRIVVGRENGLGLPVTFRRGWNGTWFWFFTTTGDKGELAKTAPGLLSRPPGWNGRLRTLLINAADRDATAAALTAWRDRQS
ncbi:hypothetical protein [Streptosporangium sp. NPDC023615]|uniref:hypothetical protein n=1 Tax=Streptosporangium sp. NPDC023615 TaxID=3154794 RepID=UPI003413537C